MTRNVHTPILLTWDRLLPWNPCVEALGWGHRYFGPKPVEIRIIVSQLISAHHEDWANWLIVRVMTYEQCIAYAVYAARLVLKFYERKYPGDLRPRQAIEAAQNYVQHRTVRVVLSKAARAAQTAARAAVKAEVSKTLKAASWAAEAAFWVAETVAQVAAKVAEAASWAAETATKAAGTAAARADEVAKTTDAQTQTYRKILRYGMQLLDREDAKKVIKRNAIVNKASG